MSINESTSEASVSIDGPVTFAAVREALDHLQATYVFDRDDLVTVSPTGRVIARRVTTRASGEAEEGRDE
jgi:hypothetical protein